jgi:hypothetical protein
MRWRLGSGAQSTSSGVPIGTTFQTYQRDVRSWPIAPSLMLELLVGN